MQIQKAASQRSQIIEQITIEKKEKNIAHSRYKEAEERIERLTRQIAVLVSKEAEMLEKTKNLRKLFNLVANMVEREIDRAAFQQRKSPKIYRTKEKSTPYLHLNFDDNSIPVETQKLEADIERIKSRTKRHNIAVLRDQLNGMSD